MTPPAGATPGERPNHAATLTAPETELDPGGAPDAELARRRAEVWHAALTGLGVMVVAAADLEELHDRAHPAGCAGCRVCRGSLALLRRVIAAARPESNVARRDGAPAAPRPAGGD